MTNTVKHCGLHSWLGTKWPRAVCLRASHCVTLYFVVCLLERLALSHFLLSIVLTSWLDYWQLSSSNVVECTHRQEGKGLLILHCWQLQVALLPLLPTLPPAQDGAFVPPPPPSGLLCKVSSCHRQCCSSRQTLPSSFESAAASHLHPCCCNAKSLPGNSTFKPASLFERETSYYARDGFLCEMKLFFKC